jgi:UDP-3-O-[3-hydroxymyristoyl] glucosamine N-acyltransferase
MQLSLSLSEIATIVGAVEVRGATTRAIVSIASLDTAQPGDLSFLGNPKYKTQVAETKASVVLLPRDYVGGPSADQAFIFLDKPSIGLARLCARIEQSLWPKPQPGVHPTAIVDRDARVAASATVGPFCVIEKGAQVDEGTHLQAYVFVGHDAQIGRDCWLMPRASVTAECILRDRVRLQAGAVVGSDGFGYEFVAGKHEKVPQIGNVIIENDVEIGANSTLDRARFSATRVGEGTKIDNLVQIGHNVIIGKHCIICAQAGVSGSSVIEDYVILGGQAGIAGHLTIGRASKVDGQTGVNSDVEANSSVKGTPCLPYQLEQRINVLRKKLPDLFKRVDALEEQLKVTRD